MSDSVRELPHEVLLRRYNLQVSSLSRHAQQMKKDLVKMAREKKERKDWIQLQKKQEEEKERYYPIIIKLSSNKR